MGLSLEDAHGSVLEVFVEEVHDILDSSEVGSPLPPVEEVIIVL